jgi:hypothetical protein
MQHFIAKQNCLILFQVVHYRNGVLKKKNPLDKQSLSLVTETFREWLGPDEHKRKDYEDWWPQLSIKIRCVKCHTKFDYDRSTAQHIQIYNWYKGYPRRAIWRRFEYLEIYCQMCERYSLWKTVNHAAGFYD